MSSLVVDISSGSVGVGLVAKTGKDPELVYSYRRDFFPPTGLEDRNFDKRMLVNLNVALGKAFHEGLTTFHERGLPLPLDHALVALSSPWIKSIVTTRKITSETKFAFDHAKASMVIEREKEYLADGSPDYQLEPLIASISQNGYTVPFPSTKKAREVEVEVFSSRVKKGIHEKIEDEIRRVFGLKRGVQYQSLPYVFSQVFLSHHQVHNPAVLAITSGECIDLVFLSNGRVREVVALNLGHNVLVRAISDQLLEPLPVAASTLALLGRDELSAEKSRRVGEALEHLEEAGLPRDAEREIYDLFNSHIHPESLYLISTDEFSPAYLSLFSAVLPGSKLINWKIVESKVDERLFTLSAYSGSHF